MVRKGNRYWGLCPFHSEKTPSFSVSAERGLFYCFGCHSGGNIFTFVMKRDNVGFREALELLAVKAGIDRAVFTGQDKRKDEEYQRVLEINTAAARFYHQVLLSERGWRAREYLASRGITEDTITRFQLGYAPDEWRSLLEYLLNRGYSTHYLVTSGVIKRSQNKDTYFDLFRNRIIFPIYNQTGQVVGMGGRSLDEQNIPKYLNTPETRIFSKRYNLYGLYQARDHIRQINDVILVEGYMDCLKLHQNGVNHAVASLGTAFTVEQARLLKRYVEQVTLVFDGDEAGQREAVRAIEVLNSEELKVRVVTLPDNHDPDEYIQIHGKEEFLQYIKNYSKNPIEFKLDRRLKDSEDLHLSEKLAILHEFYPDVSKLNSQLEIDYNLSLMARKLVIPENALFRDFEKWQGNSARIGIIRNRNHRIRNNKEGTAYSKNFDFQVRLLARMLNEPKLFAHIHQTIGISFFSDPELRQIAKLYDQRRLSPGEGGKPVPGPIAGQPGLENAYSRVLMVEEQEFPSDQEVNSFIKLVKKLTRERKWSKLLQEIQGLKAKGDFYSIIWLILKVDTYLMNEEGGES